MSAPLSGYRIIELASIGPGPYAGQLFADMGAEVILINRPSAVTANIPSISNRGKKTMVVDLRQPEGVAIALDLVKTADVIFEGMRPGVVERLGIGPEVCYKLNSKLIYGRMTGWGQTGPWAKVAGHDINYISISGALAAIGKAGEPPLPPLNLIGDYGGGTMFLVMGILAALLRAEKTGKGEIIDAAMIDGVSSLMGLFYSLDAIGQWKPERESNLIDGARPYYRCYKTLDDKFIAVGCLEPDFFTEMLSILGIDPETFGQQNDPKAWSAQHTKLEAVFASKTRHDWAEIFNGSDACVSPVLSYEEAIHHPQNMARGGLKKQGQFIHPRRAPVFLNTSDGSKFHIPGSNDNATELLTELGYDQFRIKRLERKKIITQS